MCFLLDGCDLVVPLVLPLGLSVVRHFNLSGQAKRACTLTTNGPRKPHKLFLKRDENHEISESYTERELEILKDEREREQISK